MGPEPQENLRTKKYEIFWAVEARKVNQTISHSEG